MCADSNYRKSGSPQASTEVSSLQLNRNKNKEALEKGLRTRRSIQDLVNQGILLNPSICHADKVRQLQRAKTSDILKQKIKQRPDRQYLISHHILRDDKPGTSPFVLEQCHNLEKYQLKESLNTKLKSRPGSLELVEKGVLQVDPGVDWLIRHGSIQYPRVEHERLETISEHTAVPTPPPLPPYTQAVSSSSTIRPTTSTSRSANSVRPSCSRSIKDETVVYKVGSLTFHQYRPNPSSSSSPRLGTQSSFEQKQRAREAQQAEMLRLQDTARAHRLVEQELCQRVKMACKRSSVSETQQDETFKPESSPIPLSPVSQTNSSIASIVSSSPTGNLQPSILLKSKTSSSSRSTVNSGSNRIVTCLEQLSVSQLRGECRDRNIVCTRLKAALVRQLEPFKNEIIAKYSESSSNCVDRFKQDIDLPTPPPVLPVSYPELILPQPPPQQQQMASSVWVSSVPTSVSYLTFHAVSSSSLLTPTYSRSINLCTPLSSNNVIPQAFHLYSTPSQLCQSSESSALLTEQCVTLRHSASAPFIADGSGLIPNSNAQFPSDHQGETQSPVSATTLIPVAFSNSSIHPTPISCNSNPIDPIKFDALVSNSPNSLFYLPSDLLTCSQTPTTATQFDQSQITNTPSNDREPSYAANNQTINIVVTESTDRLNQQSHIGCDLTNTPHLQSRASLIQQPVSQYTSIDQSSLKADDANSNTTIPANQISESPPSLHQIEEMWLRIRHLRRELVRVKCLMNSEDDSSDQTYSKQLEEIEHKHDHLATLCRLLIVERLDALEKMLSSTSCNQTQISNHQNRPFSDLDIEHKLLVHYLGKLGGTSLLSNLLYNDTCNRRLSSSSLNTCGLLDLNQPNCQDPMKCSNLLIYGTNNSSDLTLSSLTSQTFSVPLLRNNKYFMNGSTSNHSEQEPIGPQSTSTILVDGELSMNSTINDLDQLTTLNANCSDLGPKEADYPSGSYPSPMTTDMLFELWNSVVDDPTMSSTEQEDKARSNDTNLLPNMDSNLDLNGGTKMDTTNDTCYFSSSNLESMDMCDRDLINYEHLSQSVQNRQDEYSNALQTDSFSEHGSSVGSSRENANSSHCLPMMHGMGELLCQSTPQIISTNGFDNYQSNPGPIKHNVPGLPTKRSFWPLCPDNCNTPKMQEEQHEVDEVFFTKWNSSPSFPNSKASHILSFNNHHHHIDNNNNSTSRLNTPANEFVDCLFGSDLTDLMDTTDSPLTTTSTTAISPLKINWSVGTL